jgi:VIT1/CCC1 family predicted Fe2+/Mn2+ transporter
MLSAEVSDNNFLESLLWIALIITGFSLLLGVLTLLVPFQFKIAPLDEQTEIQ